MRSTKCVQPSEHAFAFYYKVQWMQMHTQIRAALAVLVRATVNVLIAIGPNVIKPFNINGIDDVINNFGAIVNIVV